MSRKYGLLYKSVCSQVTISLVLYRSICFFLLFFLSHFREKICVGHSEAREDFFFHFENDSIFVPGTVKRMWVWVQTGPISFLNRNWGNDILYTPPGIKVVLSVKRCLFKGDRWYELNCEEKVFVLSHHT